MHYGLKMKSPSTCPAKTWSETDGYNHRKVTGTSPICQIEAESLEVQVHP